MSKQCKELKKLFNKVIDDIFDNYDKYEVSEKEMIKEALLRLEDVNGIVEKYDKKTKGIWGTILEWFNNSVGRK